MRLCAAVLCIALAASAAAQRASEARIGFTGRQVAVLNALIEKRGDLARIDSLAIWSIAEAVPGGGARVSRFRLEAVLSCKMSDRKVDIARAKFFVTRDENGELAAERADTLRSRGYSMLMPEELFASLTTESDARILVVEQMAMLGVRLCLTPAPDAGPTLGISAWHKRAPSGRFLPPELWYRRLDAERLASLSISYPQQTPP